MGNVCADIPFPLVIPVQLRIMHYRASIIPTSNLFVKIEAIPSFHDAVAYKLRTT